MMGFGRILAAAVMLSVPAAASAAKPAAKAAAKADWTRTFAVTPAGGFRVGNPKAKVAVIEYGSLTCPHCRHFAGSAVKPLLAKYVRTGKASYEFRTFVLNGIDLAATLVARCGGAARFFPMAEQLYATQPTWVEKVGKLPQADQDKLNALPQPEMILGIAKVTGLLPIAAAHGIPAAKAQQCLKDEGAANGLMAMIKGGEELGVRGTPTIFVNGKQVAAYDWASLEPFLKEAGS
jgi:protein-disulfide isomerase